MLRLAAPPRSARLVALLSLTLVAPATAQAQPDYRRAEQFLTWNELRLVYGEYVAPTWMKDGTRFWYRVTTPRGPEFILVDPVLAKRTMLFDNGRLASALSRAADSSYDGARLPFTTFQFSDDEKRIEFGARGKRFSCDIAQYA
ncbi:MAG: hypothetical protein U0163_07680 [Gemmatimonadaceae bacterium]